MVVATSERQKFNKNNKKVLTNKSINDIIIIELRKRGKYNE